jgi:septal ring factor EnvC (AmiA/AmiB activator)
MEYMASKLDDANIIYQNRVGNLARERTDLEWKISMLNDSGCIDSAQAECKFLADAQQAKKELEVVLNEICSLDADKQKVDELEADFNDLVKQRDSIGFNQDEHKRLKELSAKLRPQAEKAAQLPGKNELYKTLKEQLQQSEQQRDQKMAVLSVNDV